MTVGGQARPSFFLPSIIFHNFGSSEELIEVLPGNTGKRGLHEQRDYRESQNSIQRLP